DMFARKGEPKPSESMPVSGPGGLGAANNPWAATAGFAALDYLADPSAVLLNLVPDKDGVVRIDRKKLGAHALVTAVAAAPLGVTDPSLGLPEQPVKFVDLRFRHGFAPASHFTQQKQVSVLDPGKPFVIVDVGGSRFEAYDSLAKVHALYATLTK